MHPGLEALEVVCRNYNAEYSNDALRASKNNFRCLTHKLSNQKTAEPHDARREAETWKMMSIAWEKRYRTLLKATRALG